MQIREQHPDIDMIFWTGDNVPHDIWNTSQANVIRHNQMVTQLINETFPGIKVFPVLGNHEAHPINLYVPIKVQNQSNDQHSMQWLYTEMADNLWRHWLSEENRQTFKRGGFYSQKVAPNWRVIVLNSNAGYLANFWRAYDPVDPDGQLAWLVDQLKQAEQAGEKVSLLGHIPMSNMYEGWKHNYIKIYDRFSHVLTGSFQGHTHNDELAVIYNHENKPIGVDYISSSLTTFSYLNPSYKIFTMDQQNGQPLDYEVFYIDLDHENQLFEQQSISDYNDNNGTTNLSWMSEFQAIKSYGLKDLTPESWHQFLQQAEQNLDLMYRYVGHYHRHSVEYPIRNKLTIDRVKRLIKQIKYVSPFN